MISCFNKITVIFLVIFVGVFVFNASAASKLSAKIAEMRNLKKSKIIRCSPFGTGDTYTPSEALAKLKRSMNIIFEPGVYKGIINIKADNLIIEGKPGGVYDLKLKIKGKKNIIRNMTLNGMLISGDVLIVDSIIHRLSIYVPRRSQCLIYNSALTLLRISTVKNAPVKCLMEHCTIRSLSDVIHIGKNVSLNINKSVLSASNSVFFGHKKDDGNICLSVSDSYMFAGKSLVRFYKDGEEPPVEDSDGEKYFEIKERNKLREFFDKTSFNGEIIEEAPLFKKEVKNEIVPYVENFQLKNETDTKGVIFNNEWLKEGIPETAPEDSVAEKVFTALKKTKTISFNPSKKWFKSYKIPRKGKMRNNFITLGVGRYGTCLTSLKKYNNFIMEFDVKMNKTADMKSKELSLFLRRDKKKYIKMQITPSEATITVHWHRNQQKVNRIGRSLSYDKWNRIRIKCSKDTLFAEVINGEYLNYYTSNPISMDIAKVPSGTISFDAVSTDATLNPTPMDRRLILIRNFKFAKLPK